jgi:hypothetical protein
MKRSFCVLALSLSSLTAQAQTQTAPPQPQLFVVHEEIAKPSMLAQYEATSAEFFRMLAQAKVDPKVFSVRGYMSPDLHYVFVSPIANFGGMDKIMGMFTALPDAVGKEKWADLMRRGGATYESYSDVVIMMRPDLSYWPASPRLKEEEHKFYRMQFYYLMPGTEMEAEAIARDYAALFKKKNIPDGYTIFMAMSGDDLPLLIASTPAKSLADFAAADDRNNAVLGADVRPLQARAMAITRRFQIREFTLRPDLVYPAPAAAK